MASRQLFAVQGEHSWFQRLRRWLWGVDDYIFIDGQWGSTGAFARDGRTYHKGDEVPHLSNGQSSYSVRTRQGWFANCGKGRIQDWSKKPTMSVALDADGYRWKGK